MAKRFDQLKKHLIVLIAEIIVRLLVSTYRMKWLSGERKIDSLDEKSSPVIIALWHNRIIFLGRIIRQLAKQKFPVTIMISFSKDGDLAAMLGERLGAKVIRGSPSRGGTQGLRGLYRSVAKEGRSILILPDGSKGPVYEAKMGLVVLSRMTQAPVLPMSCYANRFWRVRSWDRMIVPKPFSKVVIDVGEEISVSRNAQDDELENARLSIEGRLNQLGTNVEEYFEKQDK
ncbi:lysophospholipid acyltransferase family protein [Puniceicoccaceae bacterium K14]|nr:lysophospholipid acyltransferase family protein [Puniceicoccaceae bacterium K14]